MPINYTSLLKLGQPVSGTESGTWGDAVNYTVTSYLDIAISGTQTISADADVSLVLTSGNNSATNIGSTTAQYAILNCTGSRTAVRNINAPNSSKIYVVLNQTTGSPSPFGVTIRGTTGPSTYTTGVTIANGKYAVVAWKEDGVNSDFVIVATNDISALSGAPTGAVVGTTDTQTLSNKTLVNPTINDGYTEEVYTANSGTAITLSLSNGTVQIITLTGNAAITMPTAVAGKSFILFLRQDSTGSRTVTWSTVKWPSAVTPTLTATASRQDVFSFFSDGTNWYGVTVSRNYTV